MMKKLFRTLMCGAALAAALCTTAMAAGPDDLSIRLNDQPLMFTDAAPQIVDSRTYLPFRAVFTALGFEDEEITYQNETKTVSAAKEGLEISMVIGQKGVSVTENGVTTLVDTDVPAFIDPALGRTYVPVAFVAQSMGYRVAWDGESRTVFLDDIQGLLAANGETYVRLESFLRYDRLFQKRNYSVEGRFSSVSTLLGETMGMEGSYSMTMAGSTRFDMDMTLAPTGVIGAVDLSAAIPEGIDLTMRGDMTTGEIFYRSDALTTGLEEGQSNVWFRAEPMMGEGQSVLTCMDLISASRTMEKNLNGKAVIEEMVCRLSQSDPTMSAVGHLAALNALWSDSAFVREGRNWVSRVENEDGALSVVFHIAEGDISGYTTSLSIPALGLEQVTSMEGKELSFRFAMEMEEIEYVVEMNGVYTATQKAPVGAPEDGAVIMEGK